MTDPRAYILLVLAAGSSSRFGSHKQLALIDGQPLLRLTLLKLLSPAWHTIIVLGDGIDEIMPTIDDLDAEMISNDRWQEGMASSLQEGFRFVKDLYPEVQAIIVVLGDQVKLLSQDISNLIKKHEEEPVLIIATNYKGKPGVPVLFPKSAWPLIETLQGDEGARRILEQRNDVFLVDNPAAFYDVDSPEDLSP